MKRTALVVLAGGCLLAAIADKAPPELTTLQTLRAKKVKELDDAYIQALEKLLVKYTRSGDLESANAVHAELKQLGESGPPDSTPSEQSPAEHEDARMYFKGKCLSLRKDEMFFDNEWGGFVRTVPERFYNKKVTRLGMERRKGHPDAYDAIHVPVSFKVKKAGNVYIIVDERASASFMNDGWTLVDCGEWGWDETRMRGYHILAKPFETGEYTLPATKGVGTRLIDM